MWKCGNENSSALLHRGAADVGADDGRRNAEVVEVDGGKAGGGDALPGFAVGMAAVAEIAPDGFDEALHAACERGGRGGHVLDENETSAGAEHAENFAER